MGFWNDVSELNAILHKKVEEGHGKNALKEAVKDQRKLPKRPAVPQTRTHNKKRFLFGFLVGVLWQSSRGGRK